MLLEKTYYTKYKSQVIIVNFDDKETEYRVRKKGKVIVGPRKSVLSSVNINEQDFSPEYNQSCLQNWGQDTFQPLPHTLISSAAASFNRKVAFRSRLYIYSYSRGFLNFKYILIYFL